MIINLEVMKPSGGTAVSLISCKTITDFLRAHLSRLPKGGRGELSRIARHLRVTTTLVSQIFAGQKCFTAEQAHALLPFLGLTGLEAEYFVYLVQWERAGTAELKKFWSRKMEELRQQSLQVVRRVSTDRALTEAERATFYSSPLFSAVRLYCSIEPGKSAEEISQRFGLSRTRTSKILKFLTETGLCVAAGSRYRMGAQKTHLESDSPHLPRHHANWRLKALQRSEGLARDELMYTAPVSLSQKDFRLLREEMVQFIQRFLEKVHASPAEEVACFQLDFFWAK